MGRYDIMIEPREGGKDASVTEFKVVHARRGENLEAAAASALEQIGKRQYESVLRSRGIPTERIKKYGFAFEGSNVLIGKGIRENF